MCFDNKVSNNLVPAAALAVPAITLPPPPSALDSTLQESRPGVPETSAENTSAAANDWSGFFANEDDDSFYPSDGSDSSSTDPDSDDEEDSGEGDHDDE